MKQLDWHPSSWNHPALWDVKAKRYFCPICNAWLPRIKLSSLVEGLTNE